MKFKLLLMAAACIGMVACSKDDAANPSADGSKQIVLKVNLPTTRAVSDSWLGEDGAVQATAISSMNVFFTNANGTVQDQYTLSDDDITSVRTTGIRFVGLDDVTAVYIVTSLPSGINPATITNIQDFQVLLQQQAPSMAQGGTVFAGCDVDITPVEPDTDNSIPTFGNTDNQDPTVPAAGDQVYNAMITIRPIISRVEWGSITVQKEGSKKYEENGYTYRVSWSGYEPIITGVYQSNVYLIENIFGGTQASALFGTPANWESIENGAWTDPSISGITDWSAVNPVLAHTGYSGSAYAALLPTGYDPKTECVPFNFFVPFDPKTPATTTSDDYVDNTEIKGTLQTTPVWHFQLYYPDTDGYTITVEKKEAGADAQYATVTDDKALSLQGDFLYPASADHLAYANVVNLLDQENAAIEYKPGKIYTADVIIAPYNVTLGFTPSQSYNVIVKVNVADFKTENVKPEFSKN